MLYIYNNNNQKKYFDDVKDIRTEIYGLISNLVTGPAASSQETEWPERKAVILVHNVIVSSLSESGD